MEPTEVRVVLVALRRARKASASAGPGATEEIAMNIPTQTNDAESRIFPDSDEGLSRLSRRNVIFGAAAVVAALSLPKNGLASTSLSITDQGSKNNNGKDENMNSTTDIPETATTRMDEVSENSQRCRRVGISAASWR